jgi:Flp pilus assembly protein TadD
VCIKEKRKRYYALVSQGNTDTNAGDHDRATADSNKALRLNPTYAFAFVTRGFAYRKKGDHDLSNCGLQRGHSTSLFANEEARS